MPSSLPKYSGLITEHQLTILSQFLSKHEGLSKARALGALLEAWDEAGQPILDLTKLDIKSQTIDEIVAREVQHYLQANLPHLVSNLVSTQLRDTLTQTSLSVSNLDNNLDENNNTLVSNLDNNLEENNNTLVSNLDNNLQENDNTLVSNLDNNLKENNNTLVSNSYNPPVMIETPLDTKNQETTLSENEEIKGLSAEGTIEIVNDSSNSDSQRAELKPLSPEFLALPIGKLAATKILKALNIKDRGYLSRVAKNGLQPKIEGFWDYLKFDTTGKTVVWTKVK